MNLEGYQTPQERMQIKKREAELLIEIIQDKSAWLKISLTGNEDNNFFSQEGWCEEALVHFGNQTCRIHLVSRCFTAQEDYLGGRVEQRQRYLVGILLDDGKIFVPRKKGQSLDDFAWEFELFGPRLSEIEVENGKISTIVYGIKKYIREVGDFEEDPSIANQNGTPPEYKVPAVRRNRRKITAVNQSDSFGKARWRKTLVEQFYKIYPKGYESIPEHERMVLCFPGVGKEAEMWKKHGFQNEDFVFIERDEELASKLRDKYPGALVICKELGKTIGKTGEIAKAIWDHGGRGRYEKRKTFSIINIDPENKLLKRIREHLTTLLDACVGAANCLICFNFMFKRSDSRLTDYHASLLPPEICIRMKHGDMDRHDFNLNVIRFLINKVTRLSYFNSDYNLVSTEYGSYEGDSANTRMYFAMHHVTRISNQK